MFWIGLVVGWWVGEFTVLVIMLILNRFGKEDRAQEKTERDKNIMQKWQNNSKQFAEIIKIIDGVNCVTCCPNGEKKCDCFYDKQCDGLTMSRATKLWDAGYRKVSKQTLDELREELQNEFNK